MICAVEILQTETSFLVLGAWYLVLGSWFFVLGSICMDTIVTLSRQPRFINWTRVKSSTIRKVRSFTFCSFCSLVGSVTVMVSWCHGVMVVWWITDFEIIIYRQSWPYPIIINDPDRSSVMRGYHSRGSGKRSRHSCPLSPGLSCESAFWFQLSSGEDNLIKAARPNVYLSPSGMVRHTSRDAG